MVCNISLHKLRLHTIIFLVFKQAQRSMLFKVMYPVSGGTRTIHRSAYDATFQGIEGKETSESSNFCEYKRTTLRHEDGLHEFSKLFFF